MGHQNAARCDWSEVQGLGEPDLHSILLSKSHSDEEVESIIDCNVITDSNEREFKVRWKGFGEDEDTWHAEDDLAGCSGLIKQWDAEHTLSDSKVASTAKISAVCLADATSVDAVCLECETLCAGLIPIVGAVEMTKTEMMAPDEVEQTRAVMDKEMAGMLQRRFVPVKADQLTAKQKKKALRCRYSITKKRATVTKARIVAMDLKCLHKVDPIYTHAGVPTLGATRLMMADTDLSKHRISTTDFDQAFLQADGWEGKDWILVSVVDLFSGETLYFWCTGCVYGQQISGAEWAKTLRKYLVEVMGFRQIRNEESIFVNDTTRTWITCHVDDPWVRCEASKGKTALQNEDEFYALLEKKFQTKGRTLLTEDEPIDYLGMTMRACGNRITLDHDAFVQKKLIERGLEECNPTKVPLTKYLLSDMANDEDAERFITDSNAITECQAELGVLNWLALTTHPELSICVSLMGRHNANPVESMSSALKHCFRYLAGTLGQRLGVVDDECMDLRIISDSDWAGIHSYTGDTRSRGAMLVLARMADRLEIEVVWH